jgi:hypothetical protein
LVGRVSGMYQPADPLSYRIKNKNKAQDKIVHENGIKTFPESVLSSVKRHTNAAEPKENRIFNEHNTQFTNSIEGMMCNPAFNMNRLFNLYEANHKKYREFLKKEQVGESFEDIKRMLYDFDPPEHVQILYKELIDRFKGTDDYSTINRELEVYRIGLVNRYLGFANLSQ